MTSLLPLQNIPLQVFRPKEHLFSLLANQIRADGRQLSELRPVSFQRLGSQRKTKIIQAAQATSSSSWLLGSVKVSLGENVVLGVVSGTILTTSQAQGSLICNVSMNHFYPFIKGELIDQKPPIAVELEQYIIDAFIRGKLVDLKDLVLVENEYVLQLSIQLTILSQNGNLKDTCYYAAIAALNDVVLPDIEIAPPTSTSGIKNTVEPTTILLNYERNRRLSLTYAIPLTMGLFNNADSVSPNPLTYLFLDPTEKEESLIDGVASVLYHPVQDTFHYMSFSSNGIPKSLVLTLIQQKQEHLRQRYQQFLQQIQS